MWEMMLGQELALEIGGWVMVQDAEGTERSQLVFHVREAEMRKNEEEGTGSGTISFVVHDNRRRD